MQSLAKQEEMARALKHHSSVESSLENNVRAILKHVSSAAVNSRGKRWQEDLRYDMVQMIYSSQTTVSDLGGDNDTIILSPEACDKLQNTVISTLRYAGMEDRTNNITATYEKTFQWALQREQSDMQKWDNLPYCLENSSQMYWITGKAGSGKSTLMKFPPGDASSVQVMDARSARNSRCGSTLA